MIRWALRKADRNTFLLPDFAINLLPAECAKGHLHVG
jgi:hypothetical protein